MIYINMLCVALVCVVVIDMSGFMDSFTGTIRSLLTRGRFNTPMELKPFTCSFCMSHWINLGYILVLSEFTIVNYLYILILSLFTPVMKDVLEKIISKLQQWIN